MTSRLTGTIIDCADPHVLADFWCAALGYVVVDANDEDGIVEIAPAKVPDAEQVEALRREPVPAPLVFIKVPDGKSGKNRLHLDLSPIDCPQADEVARLEALGAKHADIGQGEGRSWVVMTDPEGNEFCVLRSLAPGEFSL